MNRPDPNVLNAFEYGRTMKKIQIVGLTISFALLTGCSFVTAQRVSLPTGAVQANQSRVYVYCLEGIGGKPAKISDGDTMIGNLSNHAYLCWDRAPGKAIIRARRPHGNGIWGDSVAELWLDLIEGQTYYVQACLRVRTLVPVGEAATTFSLVSMAQDEGAEDVARECKAPEDSTAGGK